MDERERAVKIVLDMANRYVEDIEGCSGEELDVYTGAITCCYRLAYVIRYGKFPEPSSHWSGEFEEAARQLYREPLTWPI